MSRLNDLRAARDSYVVKFRDFVRLFTKDTTVLFCFFEGEDVKYYGHRLEILNHELKWTGINCGGKKIVVKLRELISDNTSYSHARTAYFLDPDFDDPGSIQRGPNIYVTPSYSVENLYVTESAFRRILRSEFGLEESDDEGSEFCNCLKHFNQRLSEFVDKIGLVNYWICFHRREQAKDGLKSCLNLGSINLASMISISLDKVESEYTLADLEKFGGNGRPVCNDKLQEIAMTFERSCRHLRFRGKFQAYFMRVYLNLLQADVGSESPTCFSTRRKVPFSVSDRNFLSDLSQYADTPGCLRSFITSLS